MTPIVFPKVPEKGASDEEWTKYDKNLQDVITRYINDAIKKASDDSAVVLSSIPAIASSAQAISGVDNSCIITPLRLRDGLNASGDAPIYACRAWVNFDGTSGTTGDSKTIRASGNVSSVTETATGRYTINFTSNMPDAKYATVVSANPKSNGSTVAFAGVFGYDVTGTEQTTSATYVSVVGSGGNPKAADLKYFMVAVFR